jgi:hypothetical protein
MINYSIQKLSEANGFRPSINTTVTHNESINIYSYTSQNLFISYGLAILFAVLANILGGFAFRSNGASHTRSFSQIMAHTRHKKLIEIFHTPGERKYPLRGRVRRIQLKFGFTEKYDNLFELTGPKYLLDALCLCFLSVR